jgi:hypothetical protein
MEPAMLSIKTSFDLFLDSCDAGWKGFAIEIFLTATRAIIYFSNCLVA